MASVEHTLKKVFANVEIYPNFDPKETGFGNLSILAYNGSPVVLDNSSFNSVTIHPDAVKDVLNFTKNRFFVKNESAMTLSDDFNPMDCYDLELKESVRNDIINGTDWDILLN